MHIFFDFDQTLSKQHTVGKNHAQKSQEELRSNLKDADEVEAFIKQAVTAGHSVYIATFHNNRPHIEAYLQALLGDNWQDYISSVQLADTPNRVQLVYRSRDSHLNYRNKNDFMRAGLEENNIALEELHDDEIILVDDDDRNLVAANSAVNKFPMHVKTIQAHAHDHSANYLAELEELVASATNTGIPAAPEEPYSPAVVHSPQTGHSFFSSSLQRNTGLGLFALSTAAVITAVSLQVLNLASVCLVLPIALTVIAGLGILLAATSGSDQPEVLAECATGL